MKTVNRVEGRCHLHDALDFLRDSRLHNNSPRRFMRGEVMKKVLMLSLYALVILGCVFSTTFEMYQPVDDFGDPVGEKIVKSKALNGTYKTASVQDGKISYTITIQNGGVIQIRIVEAGNIGNLLGSVSTRGTFSVIIRPDSGPDVTTTAAIKQGDDKKYNVLQFSGASALAAFTDHNSIRIVIKNDRVTYSLGTVDTSEVEGIYYNKALNNLIDSLLASKNYDEVIHLIDAEGDTETAAYYGLPKKLGQAKMALGILEIGGRGPAGGWIFYDCDEDNSTGNADGLISSECGWRFLEAAPSDIGRYTFGYYRTDVTNNKVGTSQAIGSGSYNTERLVKYMDIEGKAYSYSYWGSTKTEEYPAKKCLDYTYGGYDDWFLPSRDELCEMYKALKCQGGTNHGGWCPDSTHAATSTEATRNSFENYYYWSSSESNHNYAWGQSFGNGDDYPKERYGEYYVRAVRAF